MSKIADHQVVRRYVKGIRAPRPLPPDGHTMSDEIWSLTQACWAQVAVERPPAKVVVATLATIGGGSVETTVDSIAEQLGKSRVQDSPPAFPASVPAIPTAQELLEHVRETRTGHVSERQASVPLLPIDSSKEEGGKRHFHIHRPRHVTGPPDAPPKGKKFDNFSTGFMASTPTPTTPSVSRHPAGFVAALPGASHRSFPAAGGSNRTESASTGDEEIRAVLGRLLNLASSRLPLV